MERVGSDIIGREQKILEEYMMRTVFVVLLCATLVPMVLAQESKIHLTFTKEQVDTLPDRWESAKTGEGEGSVWKVVADPSAPSGSGYVLAQIAEEPKRFFNLAVVKKSRFLDGEVSIRLKSVKGVIDQGGGVVWRYQDANNYYICRYNPLETNIRVYKVIEGKRTQLATKESLEFPAGEWRLLSITQKGNHIQCFLDGEPCLDVEDETIPKLGQVGLWTKADAQTCFDEFIAFDKGEKKSSGTSLVPDPKSAIESVLPEKWYIKSIENGEHPFYREEGNGTAYYLAIEGARYFKAQCSATIWIMPEDYSDTGRKDNVQGQTSPPQMILETKGGKVFLWGDWNPEWLTMKEDLCRTLTGGDY